MPQIIIDRATAAKGWTPAFLAPEPPQRRFTAPLRYTLGAKNDPLNKWVRGLENLGLGDPTEASALVAEAKSLLLDARGVASGTRDGHGKHLKNPVDAARAAVSLEREGDAVRERIIKTARREAHELQIRARRELFSEGESLVHDLLAPVAARALQDAHQALDAQARWDAAHELAGVLRGWAISSAGRHDLFYKFGRADLVHFWRLNHARQVEEHYRTETPNGTRVYLVVTEGAPPLDIRTIAEHADEWRPGLYTAAEVLENAKVWTTL